VSIVKLIAVTKMVGEGHCAEDLLTFCARASNPSNQTNFDTGPKLLRYLSGHRHWSPFEMSQVVMEIQTTRDIGRQILRHRSFSFQEFSQRYAEVDDGYQTREARLQDPTNRQNSLGAVPTDLQGWWIERQHLLADAAQTLYHAALEKGIAKEVARAVLPEGMTPTRMYMAGTLRSWIHYVQLRCGNGTQKEHMDVAMKCRAVLSDLFPNLREVLHEAQDH
jgi:thymidylate synthase (FAD)